MTLIMDSLSKSMSVSLNKTFWNNLKSGFGRTNVGKISKTITTIKRQQTIGQILSTFYLKYI